MLKELISAVLLLAGTCLMALAPWYSDQAGYFLLFSGYLYVMAGTLRPLFARRAPGSGVEGHIPLSGGTEMQLLGCLLACTGAAVNLMQLASAS